MMTYKYLLSLAVFLILFLSCEKDKSKSIESILTNDYKRTWELREIENVEIVTDCYIGDLYIFCSDSILIINNDSTELTSEIHIADGEIDYYTYCKDILIVDTLKWYILSDSLVLSSGRKLEIIECNENELIINFGDLGLLNQINHFVPVD
ncbi:MAG: hypothetical protein JSV22_05755 [Bacteroidales bacterium]|nr:MAG: hypothetical protein JSV22_05755 [Bacteroidales bacterium]